MAATRWGSIHASDFNAIVFESRLKQSSDLLTIKCLWRACGNGGAVQFPQRDGCEFFVIQNDLALTFERIG